MIADQPIQHTDCVEAWTRPAGKRGGDFIIRDINDEKVTVVLADAAGHDDEAARIAANLRPIITRQIRFPIARSLVKHWHHRVQEEARETFRFMCLTILQLNRYTRELTVINAGNPDVIIRRSPGLRLDRFASTGMPLGIVDDDEWRCPVIQRTYLGSHELAFCFSDGVTDCVGADGNRYGFRRVCRTARKVEGSSPLLSMRRGLLRFASPTAHQDDLSLLILAGDRLVA